MNREDVEMTMVQIWGLDFELPLVVVNEILELRRIASAIADRENEELREAYEAEHGPIPEPGGLPLWVPVA